MYMEDSYWKDVHLRVLDKRFKNLKVSKSIKNYLMYYCNYRIPKFLKKLMNDDKDLSIAARFIKQLPL